MDLNPPLATLVRLAVCLAPLHLRARLAEEWTAHLNDTPDKLTRLLFALDLVRASEKLRRDAEDGDAAESARKMIHGNEIPENARQAIQDSAPAALAFTLGAVTGWDALGYEFRQEQAATIGRLARELRDALDALDKSDKLYERARCAKTVADDSSLQRPRAHLVGTAAYALWHFVVQRECMGFRVTEEILKDYAVPMEVQAKMGAVDHNAILPGGCTALPRRAGPSAKRH